MSEFTESIEIHADANRVFDYIRDVRNMPAYAPTMTSAEPQSEGRRVRVTGDAGGHRYDADGSWEEDRAAMRVAWASDGESDYAGSLQVTRDGRASRVDAVIRYSGSNDAGDEHQGETWRKSAERGLKQALYQLKMRLEGTSNAG
jgi:uncharacterized membrane protein